MTQINHYSSRSLIAKGSLGWAALLPLVLLAVFIGITQKPPTHAAGTAGYPATPADTGAQICGNTSILNGPATAPAGAVTVPAGDNSSLFQYTTPAGTTYWFAPGTHTLGTDQYGQIQPGNNTTYIGAPGAILSGQSKNKYAFTGESTGVTIKYLTITLFGIGETTTTPTQDDQDEGVVNHDSGVGWTMQYNTMQYNGGGAMFLGSNNVGSYNCLTQNAQYGFQVIGNFNGAHANNALLDHNEISYNDTYDFEAKSGGNCGCTGGGKFWAASNVTVTNNYVHDNHSMGLWADTNNYGFDVENNYIADNFGTGFFYEISYNAIVKNNNFVHNAIGSGKGNPGFPVSAVYLSESGGDTRVTGIATGQMSIIGNNFSNNWGGVVAYENANRYCSSSANTSSGYCTLVNPSVATLTTCANASLLATTPYIDDCRWKSQNVSVSGNTFGFTPSAVDPSCTPDNGCGYNGIISIYGIYPPYLKNYLPDKIMWHQNNSFTNNTYTGPWQFQAWQQNNKVDWAHWSGSVASGDKCLGSGEVQSGQCSGPFGQDAGSTYNSTSSPTPTVSLSPTPTPGPGKIGDINGDGQVNVFDLSILLSHWGSTDAASDLNHDGTVSIFDLSLLLSHWGT